MSSKDGYSWTEAQGLKPGVPCIGAISPPTNLKGSNTKYDVIVVGAGYCGLTAARDAALAGTSHLPQQKYQKADRVQVSKCCSSKLVIASVVVLGHQT
jgi:heterodisulfide reductase subunit A-like polyferredoxin